MLLKHFRILQLEHSVEVLQTKLNLTFKRCQLNLLKHETAASGSDLATTERIMDEEEENVRDAASYNQFTL